MIKVLIVDDSKTLSQFLEYVLSEDPEIEVIGKCENGKEAVQFVQRQKPDIITMDIDMPLMNGLEATRQIMSTEPVPIIVVTASRNARKQNIPMEALAAGALTVIEKPLGFTHPDASSRIKKLVLFVKLYSQVKVLKRKIKIAENTIFADSDKGNSVLTTKLPPSSDWYNKKIIAIGVSTGGPEVLKEIIPQISKDFPLPILIVQHITAGFLDGMVTWLNHLSSINVKVASQGEILQKGTVYFAPDKCQMGIYTNKIVLEDCQTKSNICPSVSFLFNSLAQNRAENSIAILLTGMGSDGAKELKILKDLGALTIAQDKKSSLIHGMPGEAIKLGGAKFVLDVKQISELFQKMEDKTNN